MDVITPPRIYSPVYHHDSYSYKNVIYKNTSFTIQPPNLKSSNIHQKHLQSRVLHKPKIKQPKHAVSDVLRLMDALSISIPIDIYTSLLKECTETRDLTQAIELHQHMIRSGLSLGLSLRNRFLLLYGYCGCMSIARQLFDDMHVKDYNSWAAMLAGYMSCGEYDEAIDLFVEMQGDEYGEKNVGWFRDSWLLVCIIQACVRTENFELGRQIHGLLWKLDLEKNLFICSSLIDFYGKNGCFVGADFVFDQVPCSNTVVWTARLVNKCREGCFDEAFNVFNEMGRKGVKRNSFTYSSVLKACGRLGDKGQCGGQVHAHAIKFGVLSKSYVQCALVDMYSKIGLITHAKRVFDMNEDKNGACWNAMLRGYIKDGDYIEAIKILYEMKASDLQPQESLLNELRSACGSRGV